MIGFLALVVAVVIGYQLTTKIASPLIEKLFELVNGRTSQGVTNILGEEVITKGTKFTQKLLEKIDPHALEKLVRKAIHVPQLLWPRSKLF